MHVEPALQKHGSFSSRNCSLAFAAQWIRQMFFLNPYWGAATEERMETSLKLPRTVEKDFYGQSVDLYDSRRAAAQTIHRLFLLPLPLCIVALLIFPDFCRAISSSATPDERGTVSGRVAGPDR